MSFKGTPHTKNSNRVFTYVSAPVHKRERGADSEGVGGADFKSRGRISRGLCVSSGFKGGYRGTS